MKVAPSQQVMLKVRFLEADRTAGRDLGVNWFGGNKNGIGVSGLGAVSNSASSVAGVASGQTLGNLSNGIAGGADDNQRRRQPLAFPIRPSPRAAFPIKAASRPLPTGASSHRRSPSRRTFAGTASTATPLAPFLANVINTNGLKIDALISALEEKGLVKLSLSPISSRNRGRRRPFLPAHKSPYRPCNRAPPAQRQRSPFSTIRAA